MNCAVEPTATVAVLGAIPRAVTVFVAPLPASLELDVPPQPAIEMRIRSEAKEKELWRTPIRIIKTSEDEPHTGMFGEHTSGETLEFLERGDDGAVVLDLNRNKEQSCS